jgi:hypothetical protein
MFGCVGSLRILMAGSHSVRRAHYCAVRLTRSPLASCSPDLLASRPARHLVRRGDAKGGCTRGSGSQGRWVRRVRRPWHPPAVHSGTPTANVGFQPAPAPARRHRPVRRSAGRHRATTSRLSRSSVPLKACESPQRRPPGAPSRNPAAASAPARRTGQPNRPLERSLTYWQAGW